MTMHPIQPTEMCNNLHEILLFKFCFNLLCIKRKAESFKTTNQPHLNKYLKLQGEGCYFDECKWLNSQAVSVEQQKHGWNSKWHYRANKLFICLRPECLFLPSR